jgi:Tol biopolymer transport system component
MKKRLLEYEDLRKVEYLSAPAFAPDGRYAAYVVQTADEDGNFVPHIYEVNLESKESRLLADSGIQNLPAYSPDGSLIAYIGRKNPEDELQIWIYDRKSGAERKLTTMRHGVKEFAWSPDGGRIAFTSKWWPEEEDSGSSDYESRYNLVLTEMTPEERASRDPSHPLAAVKLLKVYNPLQLSL